MTKYKITTLFNDEFVTTYTGKDLYCAVLDKFNIEYVVSVENDPNGLQTTLELE
jgi:hypothetical protein